MANFIPKIEYGLGPTIILFEFPPEGDYLNETLDASETTNRSFNGAMQTTWGYNSQVLNPHFKLINHDIKNKVEIFFNNWASLGEAFKYFPHSDGAQSYDVVSQSKKITPKIIAIQSHDNATQTTKFFWEFDLPMIVTKPGTTAVSGAPVTSVNTRIGDVFVREIYNASESDIIATGTDTGLDAKIITVADTTLLLPETGRFAFTTDNNKFMGYDGTNWLPFAFGSTTQGAPDSLAIYDANGNLTQTAYTFPPADGTANQVLQTDGAGNVTFVDIPPTIITPNPTVINRPALYGDLIGGTLIEALYTLPVADGVVDQVLTTDGLGAVTWKDAGGGGAGLFIVATSVPVNLGTITLGVDGMQYIRSAPIAPVTLANEPFGAIAPTDGTQIVIQGTDSTNTTTLVFSDTPLGCILMGNATLGRFDTLTLVYNVTDNRYVELARNF